MKRIFNGFLITVISVLAVSCTKVDNYKAPGSTFQGRIIDKTTNANFLTETSGIQVKLEQLNWSATPTPQYIPTKPDGTYEDTKLFDGHYRVSPTQGPFWPIDPVELDIKGSTTRDFQVTPYLKITNMTHSLSGTTLTIKFTLEAPITANLPNVLEVRPFVNTTSYVGSGGNITQYSDPNKQDVNKKFTDITDKNYTINVTNLKSGRTFYARVGARVDDSYKKYNYSEVFTVTVP